MATEQEIKEALGKLSEAIIGYDVDGAVAAAEAIVAKGIDPVLAFDGMKESSGVIADKFDSR
jgi:hypothetical protein